VGVRSGSLTLPGASFATTPGRAAFGRIFTVLPNPSFGSSLTACHFTDTQTPSDIQLATVAVSGTGRAAFAFNGSNLWILSVQASGGALKRVDWDGAAFGTPATVWPYLQFGYPHTSPNVETFAGINGALVLYAVNTGGRGGPAEYLYTALPRKDYLGQATQGIDTVW